MNWLRTVPVDYVIMNVCITVKMSLHVLRGTLEHIETYTPNQISAMVGVWTPRLSIGSPAKLTTRSPPTGCFKANVQLRKNSIWFRLERVSCRQIFFQEHVIPTPQRRWQIRANAKHQVWKRREGRWTPIRAKAQDTSANPNSWKTHLLRKRWDTGLLRALSLDYDKSLMMMTETMNTR